MCVLCVYFGHHTVLPCGPVCMCAYVRACMHVCVHVCVCMCLCKGNLLCGYGVWSKKLFFFLVSASVGGACRDLVDSVSLYV